MRDLFGTPTPAITYVSLPSVSYDFTRERFSVPDSRQLEARLFEDRGSIFKRLSNRVIAAFTAGYSKFNLCPLRHRSAHHNTVSRWSS